VNHRLIDAAVALGVNDERVLQAMREVPRSRFVPPEYRALAGLDRPVPIGHGQVTTQPSLVAVMVQALRLDGRQRALEVGTGRGYQTALLARLSGFVWSIERWPDLAEAARTSLRAAGISNVSVTVGDGTKGLAEHAAFDAIVLSAAFPSVPPPLADQLSDGARLVQPIGPGGEEKVMLFEKRDGVLECRQVLIGAHFVRLVGAHGFDG
jgi:protein-L-isoaspartate(D-aspartate) O-methyltransferase